MNISKDKVLKLIEKHLLTDMEVGFETGRAELVYAINKLKPEPNESNKTALAWIKGTWNTLYQKYTIEPPIVCYGKDIRHISELLKNGLTIEQLDALANKYFDVWKNGNDKFISHNEPSVGIFYSQINKLNAIKADKPVKEL